jgi:8-oxo-dGTP pyrophosphatase MutT (NUDIX family)
MTEDSVGSVVVRHAARVLLLDSDDRILLLRAHTFGDGLVFWLAPGGGLDAGETHEAAALRELAEETGVHAELGPCVWTRTHEFAWEVGRLRQVEKFFVARTMEKAISPVRPDGYTTGHRWWTPAEVMASQEVFAPRRLAELLPAVTRGEYPSAPIDCGV